MQAELRALRRRMRALEGSVRRLQQGPDVKALIDLLLPARQLSLPAHMGPTVQELQESMGVPAHLLPERQKSYSEVLGASGREIYRETIDSLAGSTGPADPRPCSGSRAGTPAASGSVADSQSASGAAP